MNNLYRHNITYIFGFMLSLMAIATSSCDSNPTVKKIEETPSEESPIASSPFPTPSSEIETPKIEITTTPSPPTTATAPSPSPESINKNKAANTKNVDITVFTSDLQCDKHVAKKVSVSANEPVKDAVSKILEAKNTADINISNYRVNVKNGLATVDLRLSPNSQRQFSSLASCEKFALFGSLRKTLTNNPKWNIKDVRFTEGGEEIIY